MYIEGSQVVIHKNIVFLSLKIDFVLNNADPDEMLHFIWVCTVCQSIHLEVSGPQRIKYIHSYLIIGLKD